MSSEQRASYGYATLADRIEEVLGERPSTSTLRAAAAATKRSKGRRPTRLRVTLGMPAPLQPSSRTAPAAFDAQEVEAWLADHPQRARQKAVKQMAGALGRGVPEDQVISAALAAKLSWRIITAELNAHDGRGRTMAGVHKRYRHLADHGPD